MMALKRPFPDSETLLPCLCPEVVGIPPPGNHPLPSRSRGEYAQISDIFIVATANASCKHRRAAKEKQHMRNATGGGGVRDEREKKKASPWHSMTPEHSWPRTASPRASRPRPARSIHHSGAVRPIGLIAARARQQRRERAGAGGAREGSGGNDARADTNSPATRQPPPRPASHHSRTLPPGPGPGGCQITHHTSNRIEIDRLIRRLP